MFRRLRNRLILTNLVITSVVLVVALTLIYLIAVTSASNRPLIPNGTDLTPSAKQVIRERMLAERESAKQSLLRSLIFCGLVFEAAVAIVSYVLAEISIRPIRSAYESQKIFISNASHEMKTPLAAISANLEAADIQDNHWIDNISREVHALSDMNHELLLLARADDPTHPIGQDEVFLVNDLMNELVSEFQPRINAAKINFQTKISPKSAKLTLVRSDLRQILVILLDNALKYCEHEVTFSYKLNIFTVQNDGATIDSDTLPHIFERFYQIDKSSEGVGLGLSIARSLAECHEWQLSAESQRVTKFRLEV